jgi:hypothetical protein
MKRKSEMLFTTQVTFLQSLVSICPVAIDDYQSTFCLLWQLCLMQKTIAFSLPWSKM